MELDSRPHQKLVDSPVFFRDLDADHQVITEDQRGPFDYPSRQEEDALCGG